MWEPSREGHGPAVGRARLQCRGAEEGEETRRHEQRHSREQPEELHGAVAEGLEEEDEGEVEEHAGGSQEPVLGRPCFARAVRHLKGCTQRPEWILSYEI